MASDFANGDDDKYYYLHWPCAEDAKAVILLVHGLGEHCERYAGLAEYLNQHQYALCSMDLPGHGQSSGRRGHIQQFSDFGDAVQSLYDKITSLYPEKPVFLLGHSMGGLIATHFLLDKQSLFKGALLSGAAIQSPQQPPAFQVAIMRAISKIWPTLGVMTLDASQVSRDPLVVDDYMCDPLVNKGRLSARLLTEIFDAMATCREHAAKIALPIRIMHGGADVMTSPEGSESLHQAISSSDKQLKIYPELFHEIFNEPEKLSIYGEMVQWLDQRID